MPVPDDERRRFEVRVVEGADAGARAACKGEELSIGTTAGCDLRLADPAVSRHHCALRAEPHGLALRDLGSRHGTFVGDAQVIVGYVRSGALLRVGATVIAVAVLDEALALPLADGDRHGAIHGASAAMRRLYPQLEACARGTATVLIAGEAGTGKALVAREIHAGSARAAGPFVVVDCATLAGDRGEAELADAIASAEGGSVFLAGVGELPMRLQLPLLRVLETRIVRRTAGDAPRPVDVRVIAATHRELRADVNAKQFRADLYYRLDAVRLHVPPLRDRGDDASILAARRWAALRPDAPMPATLAEDVRARSWPGNVRELHAVVERATSSS